MSLMDGDLSGLTPDALALMLSQAGFAIPAVKATSGVPTMTQISRMQETAPARSFLGLGRGVPRAASTRAGKAPVYAPEGIDPSNPLDQQAAGSDIPGTMVDPRYTALVAQRYAPSIAGGEALGIPANFLQTMQDVANPPGPLPAFAPRVAAETPNAHPGWTAVAYALQHALDNAAPINPHEKPGSQFLQGLLRGAGTAIADKYVGEDQQRQALNTQNRTAAAQMNLLNAATSAQEAKASAPAAQSRLTPLSDTELTIARGYGIDTTPFEKIRDENGGFVPVQASKNLEYLISMKKGPGARALTPEQQTQANSIASGIIDGTFPPDILGNRAATPMGGAILSAIHDKAPDFDLANAKLKFVADNSNVRTQNAAQSTRYRQAIDSSNRYTNVLDYLNSVRQATGNPNAVVPLNEINQVLARNGLPLMGSPTSVATALRQYTGALQTEYGFVLSAGYAATSEDKKTAQDTINDSWGTDQFGAGLDAVRGILQIRQSSIPAGGAYTPGGTIDLGGGNTTPIPGRASGRRSLDTIRKGVTGGR